MRVEAAFRDAMADAGIEPPQNIVADGRLHRFDVNDDRRGTRNGWYVVYPDDPPAGVFGCWKRGISVKWTDDRSGLSDVEREQQRERIARAIQTQEAEKKKRTEAALRQARKIMAQAATAETHPYLERKKVGPHGLRLASDGRLIVPVFNPQGALQSLQYIAADGTKRFLKDGIVKEGRYMIGEVGERLVVCEGFATGASIHEASGLPVVIAFNAGNLEPVARQLRKAHPTAEIIIAADNDRFTEDNPGITKAAEAAEASQARVVVPTFSPDSQGTDFNDMAVEQGPEAVASAFMASHAEMESEHRSVGIRLSTVRPERVSFLWEGRLPLGKLSVLDGDPGLGKSTLTDDLAARVSRGGVMPDGTGGGDAGGVVLISGEDGLADTIVPRLIAAGADLERILALTTCPDEDGGHPFVLPDDLSWLERAIAEVDAKLVVIDPLMAFLSDQTNSHRDQHIRRVLARVHTLAESTGAAVLVVRHLNKNMTGPAIYRGGGSIGIIGAARSGLLVARDPDDDDRRVLASVKSNLCMPPASLTFHLESADQGAARVVWDGVSAHKADMLLALPTTDQDRSERDEAKDFLKQLLVDGAVPATDAQTLARAAGISEATLRRARQDLGIKLSRDGFQGRSLWSLPPILAHTTHTCSPPEGEQVCAELNKYGPASPFPSAVEEVTI